MTELLCNETETRSFAQHLAPRLRPGDIIGLQGELGAGKSVFARALMRALGVRDESMPSPTFSLIQTYEGERCKISHMDWYRLESADEIEMLGVREYFSPPWISIIEWPERAPDLLPDHSILIELECVDDNPNARLIEVGKKRTA